MSENNNFHRPLFDALQNYNIDFEKASFNGMSTQPEFYAYLNNLIALYKTFGDNLDSLVISDADNKLIFLRLLISKIDNKLSSSLRKQYEAFCVATDKSNPKNCIDLKVTNKTEMERPIIDLDKVVKYHYEMVDAMRKAIQLRLDLLCYSEINQAKVQTSSDKEQIPTQQEDSKVPDILVSEFPEPLKRSTKNKILLNLSKKEIAIAFLLFCETEIIKVKEMKEVYDFIEDNFLYIDNSKCKHEISGIAKINSAFSRITNPSDGNKSNKSKTEFIEKVRDLINDHLDSLLKVNMGKIRSSY